MKWGVIIEFMNDSTKFYKANFDTTNKTIELTSWLDTTFKSKLFYLKDNPQQYTFYGSWGKDSLWVKLNKMDLRTLPINKKLRWINN